MHYHVLHSDLRGMEYTAETKLEDVAAFLNDCHLEPEILTTANEGLLVIKLKGSQAILIPQGMLILVPMGAPVVMGIAPQLLGVFYEELKAGANGGNGSSLQQGDD